MTIIAGIDYGCSLCSDGTMYVDFDVFLRSFGYKAVCLTPEAVQQTVVSLLKDRGLTNYTKLVIHDPALN